MYNIEFNYSKQNFGYWILVVTCFTMSLIVPVPNPATDALIGVANSVTAFVTAATGAVHAATGVIHAATDTIQAVNETLHAVATLTRAVAGAISNSTYTQIIVVADVTVEHVVTDTYDDGWLAVNIE